MIFGFLLATSEAWALGFGSSAGIGTEGFVGTDFADLGGFDVLTGSFAPTFDLHATPVHVQFHVIEFTEQLVDNEELYIGANVYFDAVSKPLTGPFLGVFQPGFGVDLFADPFLMGITGQARLGPEVLDAAGFGIYVVPVLGLALTDDDVDWLAGGQLQISAWFSGG